MSRLHHVLRMGLQLFGVRSRYVETDVARHHVYDADGRGVLPPIVILPGLTDNAATFVPTLVHLRASARRVWIVESAGHGLSGPARGEYTTTRHLASVTAALDQLVDEPAVLVGNSLGGATALHYARVRPERVRALYLTSPGGAPCDDETCAFLRRAFTMRTADDARAFIELVFARPPRLAPLLARIVRAQAASPVVADILRTIQHEHTRPEELACLTMPVTIVWGRSERVLPRTALDYFREHLPPHVTIVEPDGVGHCPHLDAPGRHAREVAEFARVVGR